MVLCSTIAVKEDKLFWKELVLALLLKICHVCNTDRLVPINFANRQNELQHKSNKIEDFVLGVMGHIFQV